mmetsp:Transcript_33941/g.89395  ORF Transcript_33941/g.89395 Transcript_33941/m.89395 type:complete len:401 (+) Transcript_33941:261-1463(+)
MSSNTNEDETKIWTDMIAAESDPFSTEELRRIGAITKILGKEAVEAVSQSDVLLRHVRGMMHRELDDVAASIKEVLDWMKEDNVSELIDRDIPRAEEFHKLWPGKFYGCDKYGHPIIVDLLGEVKFTTLVEKFTPEEVVLFRAQTMEAIIAEKARATVKHGRTVSRNIYVVDFDNFSFSQFSSEVRGLLKEIAGYSNKRYVETVARVYVTRTPIFLQLIWRVVQGWADPGTIRKVVFTSSNDDVVNHLLQCGMEKKNMPTWLGGEAEGELIFDLVQRIRKSEGPRTPTGPKFSWEAVERASTAGGVGIEGDAGPFHNGEKAKKGKKEKGDQSRKAARERQGAVLGVIMTLLHSMWLALRVVLQAFAVILLLFAVVNLMPRFEVVWTDPLLGVDPRKMGAY